MEFVAAVSLYCYYLKYRTEQNRIKYTTEVLKPPFPDTLIKLLQSSSLAYLSTTDGESPHLSLMNFTYDATRQVLVMTTRKDTLKATLLRQNPKVALLIHDFDTRRQGNPDGSFSSTYSITLYGTAHFVEDPVEEEKLRSLHAKHNPKMCAFITGPTIGVVIVDVGEARICDSSDKVTSWRPSEATPPKPLKERRRTFSDLLSI